MESHVVEEGIVVIYEDDAILMPKNLLGFALAEGWICNDQVEEEKNETK
tara:strand:- start:41 stop:187 length:147 start_codon:yes stop_codon:yes gene_type:complete